MQAVLSLTLYALYSQKRHDPKFRAEISLIRRSKWLPCTLLFAALSFTVVVDRQQVVQRGLAVACLWASCALFYILRNRLTMLDLFAAIFFVLCFQLAVFVFWISRSGFRKLLLE